MLVISDASPINILVRLGLIDLLPQLFGAVIIPSAVAEELSRPATPSIVRAWLAQKPAWLDVQSPAHSSTSISAVRHRGEREALQLAQELNADLLLIDELRPRRIAVSLGLAVIGTIGILERAASQHLIDLDATFAALKQTDFYISSKLLDEAAARHRSRQDPG